MSFIWTSKLYLLGLGLLAINPMGEGCDDVGNGEDTPTPTESDATPTEADATPTPAQGSALSATIKANEGCDLSAIVTWTTAEPASSWVQFGEGEFTQEIGDDTLTTEHRVVVIGMHADSDYNLQAVSETADGTVSRSQALAYETGPLPYAYMKTDGDILNPSKAMGGWTLYNASTNNMDTDIVIQMVDASGETIWYYIHEGGSGRLDSQVTWVDGTVLYGPGVAEGEAIFRVNLEGEIVWEGPIQEGDSLDSDGTFHHVTEATEEGGVFLVQIDRQTVNGVAVASELLREFNAEGEEVWSWEAIDHTDVLPLNVQTLPRNGDWLHVNSAALDPDGEAVYFSSLRLQQIVKIDKASKEIEWVLGEGGDFAADPDSDRPWFGPLHAMEYLGDNRFMLYDNSDNDTRESRGILYSLDEDTMEATIEWSFGGEDGDTFYNNVGGDCDLLPNGNRLLVSGSSASGNTETRLMEVTADGEVVWQVWLRGEGQSEATVSSFQADRIDALTYPL